MCVCVCVCVCVLQYTIHYEPTSRHRSQKRKVVKIHVMKEESGLGVELFGGKGSKFGDIGIFIHSITEGSWVQK